MYSCETLASHILPLVVQPPASRNSISTNSLSNCSYNSHLAPIAQFRRRYSLIVWPSCTTKSNSELITSEFLTQRSSKRPDSVMPSRYAVAILPTVAIIPIYITYRRHTVDFFLVYHQRCFRDLFDIINLKEGAWASSARTKRTKRSTTEQNSTTNNSRTFYYTSTTKTKNTD